MKQIELKKTNDTPSRICSDGDQLAAGQVKLSSVGTPFFFLPDVSGYNSRVHPRLRD